MSEITLYDGNKLVDVHSGLVCLGQYCPIHKPSEHPLNTAPFAWMEEVRALFRVCEHGFWHPDPDDMRYKLAMTPRGWLEVEAIASVHMMKENCDDCCQRKEV